MRNQRLSLRIATVILAVASGGTAMAATLPGGLVTGSTSASSGALVTLAIPSIVGVNVGHNFVLDFKNGSGCWGSTSTQGTFPQAASGNTTYTFAVTVTAYDPTAANVACPGGGGSVADVATVQVYSTAGAGGKLQASIQDGGHGGQTTTLTALISDIFSANRLKLAVPGGDSCGGGTKATMPWNLGTAAASEVTAIPTTGWSDCKQTLSLLLAPGTAVATGTATGTLTFTMSNP